jgi:hypothetical protein
MGLCKASQIRSTFFVQMYPEDLHPLSLDGVGRISHLRSFIRYTGNFEPLAGCVW